MDTDYEQIVRKLRNISRLELTDTHYFLVQDTMRLLQKQQAEIERLTACPINDLSSWKTRTKMANYLGEPYGPFCDVCGSPHDGTIIDEQPVYWTHSEEECIKNLKTELAAAQAALSVANKGLRAVEDLIDASDGVYGLHLNGDNSPWDELIEGGSFESWLLDYCIAIDAARKEGA
jgi:hypothetical protein